MNKFNLLLKIVFLILIVIFFSLLYLLFRRSKLEKSRVFKISNPKLVTPPFGISDKKSSGNYFGEKYSTVGKDREWILRFVQPLVLSTKIVDGKLYLEGEIYDKNNMKVNLNFYLGDISDESDSFEAYSEADKLSVVKLKDIPQLIEGKKQIRIEYLSTYPSNLENCSYGILCKAAEFARSKFGENKTINLELDQSPTENIPVTAIYFNLNNK